MRIQKRTGDLALRWEVARDLALRTPTVSCVVAAHKTHAIVGILGFQPGETSSFPGNCVLPAPEDFSAQWLLAFLWKDVLCLDGTASEEVGQQNR